MPGQVNQDLNVRLGVDPRELEAGVGRTEKAFNTAAKAAGTLTNAMGRLETAYHKLQLRAGQATGGFIALGFWEAAKLEESFLGVTKTVSGTAAELRQLEDGLQTMSAQIPSSVHELMQLAGIAGQLGVATTNIEEFTKVATQLGVATDMSADMAITALSRFMTVTNEATDQADNLASGLVQLGNISNTTEGQIFNFAQNIAGTASAMGATSTEIMGIATAFSEVGIQAEAGGTAVQRVLIDMNNAVQFGGQQLANYAALLGMTADEFTKLWKANPAEVFSQFVESLKQAKTEAPKVLSALGIDDVRLVRAMTNLANSSTTIAERMADAGEAAADNVALAEEAGKRYGSLYGQMQLVNNQTRKIASNVSEGLLGPSKLLVDIWNKILSIFTRLTGPAKDVWGLAALAMGGRVMAKGIKGYMGLRAPSAQNAAEIAQMAPVQGFTSGFVGGAAGLGRRRMQYPFGEEAPKSYQRGYGAGRIGGEMVSHFIPARTRLGTAQGLPDTRAIDKVDKQFHALGARIGLFDKQMREHGRVYNVLGKTIQRVTGAGVGVYRGVGSAGAPLAQSMKAILPHLLWVIPLVYGMMSGVGNWSTRRKEQAAASAPGPAALETAGKAVSVPIQAWGQRFEWGQRGEYTGPGSEQWQQEFKALIDVLRPLKGDAEAYAATAEELVAQIVIQSQGSVSVGQLSELEQAIRFIWGEDGTRTLELNFDLDLSSALSLERHLESIRGMVGDYQQAAGGQGGFFNTSSQASGASGLRRYYTYDEPLDYVFSPITTSLWRDIVGPDPNSPEVRRMGAFGSSVATRMQMNDVGGSMADIMAMFESGTGETERGYALRRMQQETRNDQGDLQLVLDNGLFGPRSEQSAEDFFRNVYKNAEVEGAVFNRMIADAIDIQYGGIDQFVEALNNGDITAESILNTAKEQQTVIENQTNDYLKLTALATEFVAKNGEGLNLLEQQSLAIVGVYSKLLRGMPTDTLSAMLQADYATAPPEAKQVLEGSVQVASQLDIGNAAGAMGRRLQGMPLSQARAETLRMTEAIPYATMAGAIKPEDAGAYGEALYSTYASYEQQRIGEIQSIASAIIGAQRSHADAEEAYQKQLADTAKERVKTIARMRRSYNEQLEDIAKQERKAVKNSKESLQEWGDAYRRLGLVPIQTLSTVVQNMEIQVEKWKEMQASLTQLRGMGLTNPDLIEYLGLNDPSNYEQANEFIRNALANPGLIQDVNQLWNKKWDLAGAFADTSGIVTQVKEDFNEMREDAKTNFDRSLRDIEENYQDTLVRLKESVEQQHKEINKSITRMAEDMGRTFEDSLQMVLGSPVFAKWGKEVSAILTDMKMLEEYAKLLESGDFWQAGTYQNWQNGVLVQEIPGAPYPNPKTDTGSVPNYMNPGTGTIGSSKHVKHAVGGIATSEQEGIIAEAGPEAIIPLDDRGARFMAKLMNLGSAQGGAVEMGYSLHHTKKGEVAAEFRDELEALMPVLKRFGENLNTEYVREHREFVSANETHAKELNAHLQALGQSSADAFSRGLKAALDPKTLDSWMKKYQTELDAAVAKTQKLANQHSDIATSYSWWSFYGFDSEAAATRAGKSMRGASNAGWWAPGAVGPGGYTSTGGPGLSGPMGGVVTPQPAMMGGVGTDSGTSGGGGPPHPRDDFSEPWGNPFAPNWDNTHLTTVKWPGGSFVAHRISAYKFAGLLRDLLANGYRPYSVYALSKRKIEGSSHWSEHAWGNAIDIDPADNAGDRWVSGKKNSNQYGIFNPNIVGPLARKWDLTWGGLWDYSDPMHFEYTRGARWGGTAYAASGAIVASRTERLVMGESGKEAVIPLNHKGVDVLHQLMKRFRMTEYRQSPAHVDQSTHFGPIQVVSQNPDQMISRLKTKQRVSKLTRPGGMQ